MTPEERAVAIAAAMGTKTVTYTFSGITFRVSNASAAGPVITVTVAAWTGAGANRVDLPVGDGIFRFVNPPLMVPNGGFDPEGRATFTRDDLTAAKQIVYDAVTACARRLGWTP